AAGNIYGEAYGGTYLDGTVFELSPDGSGGWNPTVIHNFAGYPKDGTSPTGTLVFDKAGNLYGTTYNGGAKKFGTVYKLSPVTTGTKKGTWTEKVLYSFKGAQKTAPALVRVLCSIPPGTFTAPRPAMASTATVLSMSWPSAAQPTRKKSSGASTAR